MNKNKLLLTIVVVVTLCLALLLVLLLSSVKSSVSPEDVPSPTLAPNKNIPSSSLLMPKNIQRAPTYPPDKGAGIDIESEPVKTSITELEKLSPFLPFNKDITMLNGDTVSIVIPPKNLQNNPWTLTVQIFGIDYQTTPDQPSYTATKQAFKQAASEVFVWMKTHDVDPRTIYISWGEQAYIQDQAEKWLQEK